jgi:hypothetical protein
MDPRSAIDMLLRCLSGRGPGTGDMGPTTDWNNVVDVAVRHDLAPLLFKRLKEGGARTRVPADAWERLRLAYFASAKRNTRLFRELRTVLECLRAAGIPVIVLKGAYLAEAVYGDVAVRPMCDADLMVPRAELPRAQAVLLDMGGVLGSAEDIESFSKSRHHLPPVIIRDLQIELHWTIIRPTEPVRIDVAGLWNRAHPATTAGVEVLALSPEDLLMHICLHFGCDHHLTGLRSFCDITETIHRYRGEMDWLQVADSAREWGAARYVGLTLHLSRRMLGTDVPDDVLERLVPGGIDERVLETARQSALADTGYEPWSPVSGLVGARSLSDKAKLLWQRVFLSRDEMARVHPASRDSRCLSFYYGLRFRDVLRNRGTTVLRLAQSPSYRQSASESAVVANWLRSGKS